MEKKNKRIVIESLAITAYAAEGRAIGKLDGKVIFVTGAVPGDVVDVQLTKNKKEWAEGRVVRINRFSTARTTPFCLHFGICGGCKWQMLPYDKQLEYKQQEALQNLQRIGKIQLPGIMPIIGSADTIHYRNKLEFTFSNKRYRISPNPSEEGAYEQLANSEASTEKTAIKTTPEETGALGFHVPRIFDKVLDIRECFLMDGVNNRIRDTVRSFAEENNYTFYNIREHSGWLRNIIIRYCTTGELMVNICLNYEAESERKKLFDHLLQEVPGITTLLCTINPKWNDTIYDLEPIVYHGKGFVLEKLGDLTFKISPKSFFQTNTRQAEKLYSVARDFAGLTGTETVYDLYCGTGSIGIFVSKYAGKVIGVEAIEDAVKDARENATLNNIQHAEFFTGDVIKVCTDAFFEQHGRPDVIFTDPPRAGMHDKLIDKLLEIAAQKIVYVSCNTATQARDISLLASKYRVERIQPVDMFPHTHHIECVVLLTLK